MFGSERHEEVEGKRIKQKHDEKKKNSGTRKNHIRQRNSKLPCASLAYYSSYLIMWQVFFGDGCLSATVTGIAMIAVLCGCLHKRERRRKIFFNITDAHTEKERATTQRCTYPPSQFRLWLQVILPIKATNSAT